MRHVVSRVATAPEVAYAARPAARRVAADAKVLTAPAPALVSLAAIDGLIDKIDKQVRRYKEPVREHHGTPVKTAVSLGSPLRRKGVAHRKEVTTTC